MTIQVALDESFHDAIVHDPRQPWMCPTQPSNKEDADTEKSGWQLFLE